MKIIEKDCYIEHKDGIYILHLLNYYSILLINLKLKTHQ